MDSTLRLVSATGNRFALFDGMGGTRVRDASALAKHLGGQLELGLDGLLQVLPPREEGDCRMVLHNVDGSRAEACGNGLRCIALRCLTEGHVEGPIVLVETDCGLRQVESPPVESGPARARTSMGSVRVVDPELVLRLAATPGGDPPVQVPCVEVDAGNPHCVLLVEDAAAARVRKLGPRIETHPHFPERTNVEFVEVRDERLRVRVWERGVGETRSCGTGATAAALVAVERGLASFPLRVQMPGGVLVVLRERGEVILEGEVELESGRFLRLDPEWFVAPETAGGAERAADTRP